MFTITISNRKGGTGKTTTTQALAGYYRSKGKKVLLIDTDYQGNLSNAENKPQATTIYDFIIKSKPILGDFVASNEATALLPKALKDKGTLKAKLKAIAGNYDIAIIDTPPALDMITINAIYASDIVIIPTSSNSFGLQGIQSFKDMVDTIRDKNAKAPVIDGILLTQYKDRTKLSKGFTEAIQAQAKAIGIKVYKATIPQSVIIEEAQALGVNLFDYAPKSKPAIAYANVAKEIKERM